MVAAPKAAMPYVLMCVDTSRGLLRMYNHSIERTCSGELRLPPQVAHIER